MKTYKSPLYTNKFAQRGISYVLLFSLVAALMMAPGAASARITDTISVGLNFVKNALFSANLQNVTGYGSGYSLGVYEEDAVGDRKVFRGLAEIDDVEITMLTDQTMYLSGGKFYQNPQGAGDIVIGAYHLELAYSYPDYDAARQAADNYNDGFVAYSYGEYYVRFGSYSAYRDASADAEYYSDCTVTGGSEYGMTVVNTVSGEILFELDNGRGTTLGVEPIGVGECRTWFKGYQYNGGFRYDRPEGGAMHVANIVPLEQYVAAVLSREFVVSWPDEALKAAACCIRTFVKTSEQHETFDVCNDVCCQVYRGVYQGAQWTHLEDICMETAGACIYYNGSPILAVYHSSNGGATVSSKDAWSVDHPYLQGVYDPFESTVKTGAKGWSKTFTLSELTELAQTWGFHCDQIVDIYISAYTDTGNVAEVTFEDRSGKTHAFTGENTALLGGEFFSRRYVIIPPGGKVTVTDVVMGEGATGAAVPSDGHATASGTFAVYDGVTTTTMQEVAVITAAGTEVVNGAAQVLSAGANAVAGRDGYPSAAFETKTVTNDTNQYMVYGSGWGHNVGLSAYGAYAMALQGYTYQQILKYYYQNVEIW